MTTTIQSNVSTVTTETVRPSLQVIEVKYALLYTSNLTKEKLLRILLDEFVIQERHKEVILSAIDSFFLNQESKKLFWCREVAFSGNNYVLEKGDTLSSEEIISFMHTENIRSASLVEMILFLHKKKSNGHLIALGTVIMQKGKKTVFRAKFDYLKGKWNLDTRLYKAMHCARSDRNAKGHGGGYNSDFPDLKGWNPQNLFLAVREENLVARL